MKKDNIKSPNLKMLTTIGKRNTLEAGAGHSAMNANSEIPSFRSISYPDGK